MKSAARTPAHSAWWWPPLAFVGSIADLNIGLSVDHVIDADRRDNHPTTGQGAPPPRSPRTGGRAGHAHPLAHSGLPRSANATTGIRLARNTIKRCMDLRQIMQQSHLIRAPSTHVTEASATPILPGRGAPFPSARRIPALITTCIQANSYYARHPPPPHGVV
jgi:hypothetical protein